MKTLLKWILAVLATVAVLLLIVSLVLPMLINPNNYKDEISAEVLKRTGRELAIAGDISWRVFPSLGIEVESLSLANRPGFGVRPMLKIAGASATVKLLPLFSRQLEIRQVDFEGVSAYLLSNTDGQNNWEDLVNRGQTEPNAVNTAEEVSVDFEAEISNGKLSLINTDRRVDIDGFNIQPEAVESVHGFELQGKLNLDLPQHGVTGQLAYEGLLQLVRGRGLLGVQDLELSFTNTSEQANNDTKAGLQLGGDVIIDLVQNQAMLTDLLLQFSDLRASGGIEVTSLLNEPQFAGNLELAEFSPRAFIQDLGLEVPRTRGPDALTLMRAKTTFRGSAARLELPDLNVALDKSNLNGNLTIQDFDPLRLSFNLDVDTLNLDEYSLLTENADEPQEDAEIEGSGLFIGSMLLFNGRGDLRLGRLVANGLVAENVRLGITSNADEIRLFPISSDFYGGQHQGDIRVGFGSAPPVVTISQLVSGFDVSRLLKGLADSDRVRGTGDLYLQVNTVLGSSLQVRQALSGDMGLSIMDGFIDDIDVAGTVAKVATMLGQQDITGAGIQTADGMAFDELIVSGMISRGIFNSDDLLLSSALVNATGEGSVNLVNETVNYTVYPIMADKLAAQFSQDLRDISIPVKITGSMHEPNIAPDITAGITATQKARLGSEAGEIANSLLRGLFGEKKDGQ